jgi:hypothetical protein
MFLALNRHPLTDQPEHPANAHRRYVSLAQQEGRRDAAARVKSVHAEKVRHSPVHR